MRIGVLGPLRLEGDDGCGLEIPERKVRRLLIALVAHRGSVLGVDGLVEKVWAEEVPTNPMRTLRAKVSQLRALLDHASRGARSLLVTTDGGYRLNTGEDTVDADVFAARVRAARLAEDPARRARLLGEALAIWRGEPYADAADVLWLAPVIAELAEQRLTVVEEHAEALLDAGESQLALDEAGQAAAEHPARERLVGVLMLALYRLGRQHEALDRFAALRLRLADEFGADPGPELRELHERMLRQDDGLQPRKPPPGRPLTNLPAEVSPLIGRDAEVAELDRQLDSARLVTLTGPGGVGKTRLAVRVATARRDRHPRGVWFVDLTVLEPAETVDATASAARVAEVAAFALALPDPSGDEPGLARLATALGGGASLLVLDNCEHVVDEVAAFVAGLLAAAGSACVLTTSREPLGLPAEQRYLVQGMTAGTPDDPGPAVALFAERARAVTADFTLDAATFGAVAELCRHLDGLPLALELAANRLRVLTVAELLERLTDRLNLLSRPGRGVPRRQQTLRGMLDWSWSLLDQPDRVLLRRLAVHRGGFSLAAAEACAGDLGTERPVLDVLTGLVECSLVGTGRTRDGTARFHLLEVVTVYAAEQLDATGERDEVIVRYLDHHIDLARRADAGLRGADQRRWIEVLDTERGNLRHVRNEAVRRGDGDRAIALALATFWYRWITGRTRHLGAEFAAVLRVPGSDERLRARARVLGTAFELPNDPALAVDRAAEVIAGCGALDEAALASVQWFLGSALAAVPGPPDLTRREAAARYLREAAEVFQRVGDDWQWAIAHAHWQWWTLLHGGHYPAPSAASSPMAVFEALGDRWGLQLVLGNENREAELAGDTARSAAIADRVLELCRDLGMWGEVANWTGEAAHAAVRRGAYPSAAALLAQARALAGEVSYEYGLRFADLVESVAARCQDDLVLAREAMDRWIGSSAPDEVLATVEDGFLALREGDRERALAAYTAITTADQLTGAAIARVREMEAGLRVLDGDPAAARRLLTAAAGDRAAAGHSPTRVEQADAAAVHRMIENAKPS